MAGQFKTRRGAGGRFESIPEEEQGALRAAAEGITAPPPAASITQQDVDFVNAGQEPPPLPDAAEPPPLPPQAPPVQPPPLPAGEDAGSAAGQAAGTIARGSLGGPLAAGAAAVTAGVGYAASQSFKKAPVGSLDGGSGQTGGGDQDVLRQLLAVQQGIARVGSPIKDAIMTTSAGARI